MTTIQDTGATSSLMAAMNPAKAAGKSEAAMAQDKFMTLLVTQMKNQDPLNPLDNAQVTSQLAQLSTVTGIDKLNTTLEGLMGSYQSSQTLQAASMIGHGVFVPGSKLELVEGKALMGLELTEPADKVQVTIRDASGKAVHTIDLGSREVGTHPLQWDGAMDGGKTAADGVYTFEVAAARGNENAKAATLTFGSVASVSTGSAGVQLNVTNIGAVDLTAVRQIL
jgi:flagellar basal-body rod modification protein FlgD